MEGSDGSGKRAGEGDGSESDGSRPPQSARPLSYSIIRDKGEPRVVSSGPHDSLCGHAAPAGGDAAMVGAVSLRGDAALAGVDSLRRDAAACALAAVDSLGGDAVQSSLGGDAAWGHAVQASLGGDEAGAVSALLTPQLAASQAIRFISSSKKRSRDNDQVMEDTKPKTMQDAGCQTDIQFTEVEARDQSASAAEIVPYYQMQPQMQPPMYYQMPGPWWQWMYPPPQVSMPTMQSPSGRLSWPIDAEMGHSQISSPMVSPMSPWQQFSLPVVQGLAPEVRVPPPTWIRLAPPSRPESNSRSIPPPPPTWSSSGPSLMTPLPRPTPNAVEPRPWTGTRHKWIVGSRESNLPTPPTRKRTPPPHFPPYPKGQGLEALKEWDWECRKVSIIASKDPVYNLPFLEKHEFPSLEKPKEVVSKSDKDVVHKVASSLVNVSSVDKDGVVVLQCTGVIIGSFKESGPPIILTTSNIICDASGNLLHHKVLIRQDNNESDGKILFYDSYYKIAFLGISSGCLLGRPSLLSTLEFGDKVFMISTDGSSSLEAREGEVLWFEKSYLGRNFYKYLSCKLPKCCVGGPVVDDDGNISGMALIVGIPIPAVIPSSIIVKCIEMYKKFGCIARPEHGISLRTLESLDLTTKRGIMVAHKIENGYIVDKVLVESDAERFDIRLGDIIVSFNGMNSQSLLELELYLLSLGCEFLQNNFDSSCKIIIELEVYDPLAFSRRRITLPVGFSSSAGTTDDGNMK